VRIPEASDLEAAFSESLRKLWVGPEGIVRIEM